MKTMKADEILAKVHAVKDALSREAGFDVAPLVAASRHRCGNKDAPVVPAKVKKPIRKARRQKSATRVA